MDIDVAEIRKIAAVQAGKRYLEERSAPAKLAAVDAVLLQKAASADRTLLGVAVALRPDNPLAMYENLGGTYDGVKEAVSTEGIRKAVSSAKATPERLEQFGNKMWHEGSKHFQVPEGNKPRLEGTRQKMLGAAEDAFTRLEKEGK